ncbi:MAG: hypothetical protein HY720_09615 [Planctomycetes bacterium]|nr:hypothetical protein [Planctomycetota bacterium]
MAIALFLSLAGNVALVVLHPASRGRQTEEALGPNDASSTDGDATAPTAQSTALLEEKLREADRKREEDGKEIDRLKTEKTQLASDKKDLETKVVTLTEEKEKLREERDAAYQNPGPPADDGPAPAPLEGGPIPESEANRIQYAWLPLPETLPERLDIPRTVDGARWEKVDVRLRPNGPIREEDLKKEPGSLAVGTKDLLDMNPKSGWDLTITCSGQRLEIARQLNAAERWKQLIASVQWLILEDNEGHECHYLVQPLDPVDRDWPAGRATLPIPLAFLDAWEPDPPTIALQRKARTIAVSWEQSQEGLDLHAVFFKERWAAARDACRGAPEVTGLSSTKQDEFRESRDKANTDLKSLLDKSKHFPDKETEEKTALSPVEVKALGDFRKILKDIEVLQPELENLLPKDANDWARRYKAARDTLLGILDSRDLNALSRAGSEEAVIEMTAPDNSGKLQKIQVIRITFQG